MNIYDVSFYAVCPVNGVRVKYDLSIQTGVVIKVEDILARVEAIQKGIHEEIADRLQDALGGAQTLTAFHHGVTIKTLRPHLAHWSKPDASSMAATPGY